MNKLTKVFTIALSIMFFQQGFAQNHYIELGLGIGNVTASEHSLGKAELHLSAFKDFQFGQLGLDFATGGNFIPGERSTVTMNSETLSPNDTRFGSIMLVYRLPVKEFLFIEPRLGHASLSAFVHTDDRRKINQANLSAGIGIGGEVNRMSFSLRYQYVGKTAAYEGFRGPVNVLSTAEQVSLILVRVSYRISLDELF